MNYNVLNYKVISTGSKGNCITINNVMVDCGVPFKSIKNDLYDVDTLLLTHIHSDHIKPSTLKNIVMMFPHIRIFGNYEVVQTFDEYPIQVVNETNPFVATDGTVVMPFLCPHDVVCYGYVWNTDGKRVIYATDTTTMEHAPEGKFDYFFIESNHDENIIAQLDPKDYMYNVIAGAQRHLSTQQAKTFYYVNRRSNESNLIELHMSSRFY